MSILSLFRLLQEKSPLFGPLPDEVLLIINDFLLYEIKKRNKRILQLLFEINPYSTVPKISTKQTYYDFYCLYLSTYPKEPNNKHQEIIDNLSSDGGAMDEFDIIELLSNNPRFFASLVDVDVDVDVDVNHSLDVLYQLLFMIIENGLIETDIPSISSGEMESTVIEHTNDIYELVEPFFLMRANFDHPNICVIMSNPSIPKFVNRLFKKNRKTVVISRENVCVCECGCEPECESGHHDKSCFRWYDE